MGWNYPILGYLFGDQVKSVQDSLAKYGGGVLWIILIVIIVIVALWAWRTLRGA